MTDERILIVEDEGIVALDLANQLERLGYKVVGTAVEGPDALDQIAGLQPDLILMDIRLAGEMDGITVADVVRTEYQIPVVFLTAHSDDETLARAKLSEPYGYLIKPFDVRELRSVIEIALFKHASSERERLYRAQLQEEVAERQRAETALSASESLYRSLVETSPDAIMLTDLEGTLLTANQQTAVLFGYDDLTNLQDNGSNFFDHLAEESVAQAHVDLESTLHMGRSTGLQYCLCRHDGTTILIECNVTLVRDDDGDPAGLLSIIRDITARMQAEEALKLSEERHRVISQLASDYFYIMDVLPDGTMVTVWIGGAFEAITGYSSEKLTDFDQWIQVIHPDDIALIEASRSRMLNNETLTLDYRIRIESGEERWLRDQVWPICDESVGRVIQVMGTVKDITEVKHREGQRFELALERERSLILRQFVQDASHDLRTPLTAMRINLYLLQRLSKDKAQIEHIRVMGEQLSRMHSLLEDMLNMTRLDVGGMFHFAPLDINVLVQQVVMQHSELAELRGHMLDFSQTSDIRVIQGDKSQLQRALGSVVSNALLYTGAGGLIRVRVTSTPDEHVVIEVEDNGIGISAEALPRIFDRFYRADKSRGTETGGMGLGLTIAQKIVEGHHGRIEVESVPDFGSTFRIVLPVDCTR